MKSIHGERAMRQVMRWAGSSAARLMVWLSALSPALCLGATDPARLAPEEALLYAGWSKINDGDWRLLQWAEAVLGSTLVAREADAQDRAVLQALLEVAALAAKHTGAFSLLPFAPPERPAYLVVIHAQGDTEALNTALQRLAESIHPPEPIEQRELGGVSYRARKIPGSSYLGWAVSGEHVLIANAKESGELAAQIAAGKARTLADTRSYALAREKLAMRGEPWHFGVHVQAKIALELLRDEIQKTQPPDAPVTIEQVFATAGLDAVQSWTLACEPGKYGKRLGMFLHVAGEAGVLGRLLRQKPLRDEDLRLIPMNAHWASAWNLNLHELWRDVQKAIEKIAPDAQVDIDGVNAMIRQFLGFSLTDDLLPALGDTAILYDAPPHGGALFTGAVLIAEVAKPAELEGMIGRAMQTARPLASQGNVELTVRQLPGVKPPVNYMLAGGFPLPVAPAWSLFESRGVFGLYPQTVTIACERLRSPAKQSLLEHSDWADARAELMKEPVALGYLDSRSVQHWWYTLRLMTQTALAALSVGGARELDLAALPTFRDDLSAVRNTFWAHSADADGLLVMSVGTSPWQYFFMAESGALLGLMMIGTWGDAAYPPGSSGNAAMDEINDLRNIAMACEIWAADHDGKHPESLASLVEAGFLTEADVHADDQDARISYTFVRGLNTKQPPLTVLAYRHDAAADRVRYVRIDGAVETLPLADFKERLRTALKLAGREADFPAEWR